MRATVIFAGRDEIAGRLRDNIWEAARAVLEGRPERTARELLLDGGQVPFSHVLGPADTGTAELVRSAARAVHRLARDADAGDQEAYIRRSPVTARIVDALLAALRDRFLLLDVGELHRDPSGWPESWTWETRDHAEFHRVLGRFSTDRAEHHGRLFTPLVKCIETSTP
ncbi:hypothetical protein [Actinomadura latina]|uniref:Uncharacterized protein n=1 Tax=Actinomadura latina TaxID=163603 RepID=A0A846Z8A9_9ACTN|nr:hypothetical protein [Actinomadura latina]NKZ08017.1 hypothetical protein [Actinomadura latina]